MERKTIDGKCFARMLHGGAILLSEHMSEINDLNVFPVPDGDTGTNMTKTLEGGLSELGADENETVGDVAGKFAHGVLLGARGNSGVILSQFFAGINEALSKCDKVDAKALADAYGSGVKRAYASVQNPTEGTILTVFRESTEYAAANITDSSTIEDFFRLHIERAKSSLAHTKELLPVLAEADVVDSGAAGYLYIILGMYDVLTGKISDASYKDSVDTSKKTNVDINTFTRDSKLEFGYCTEFLLRLTTDKTDPDKYDINTMLDALNSLGGESIVAYKEGDIVKVHVHTFTPGEVLTAAQQFGEFLTIKIENMSIGHSGEEKPKERKKINKKFSTLAVASGDGICALFREMGADMIVAGGQTANPSTEEFLEAFDACEAENIIVLPNNKNVVLAAKQAAEMYDKAKVYIIPTTSPMQCYGALSVITPGITDIDALVESAERAKDGVFGSEITRAVRDAKIHGVEVKEGDYIAIANGEILATSTDANSAVIDMIGSVDAEDYEILTVFAGKDVSEDMRVELIELIEENYPDLELTVYEGGQDVYHYMIALE